MEMVFTFTLVEIITNMLENKQLFLDVNQLREEQQHITRKLEPLPEEVLQITYDIRGTRATIKQTVQKNEER